MLENSSTLLDPEIDKNIRQLCEQGYLHFDQGDTKAAIRTFYSAWTLLPKPQTEWEQAGWILTALGDAYFAKGDFNSGREALSSALHCPKAAGNPVIHLRLGQCEFELGALDNAQQQFELVKQNGGNQLFAQVDPKYLLK
ncbi:tol-pal system YbgF family protein [Oceanicoccus sp. KOV_DT_Chl]|uniref:tetratricopeptide repeat protein n=1 Tax=Oceanicoccus sp. KOV_DT_Chl TaxID=1904639 RepID=UPI000C7C6839|nr:hypothetical protein [Oceanicoccus sp. KOV_DT_Chl]